MNTFKRKALSTVVLGALGAAAGAAHAVYQDPTGLGQALIYPYYSVQTANGSAFNTYISVVNSTSQGKVLKVRAREGKTSAEVIDFNLYLSPNDVWTAAIIPADGTAAAGARLITADVSCTNPAIPAGGVDFRNYQYVGDGLGNGLDRTREGYMEIIEMATIVGTALTAATHNSAGTPTCTGLVGPTVATTGNLAGNLRAPTGGVNGTGTLINVNNGVEMGYNATALANVSAGSIYAEIGTELGTLADADPVSVVVANNRVYRSDFPLTSSGVSGGVRAVSATIDRSAVINEYVLDTATRSNTDWVMTFPTKHFFYVGAAGTPEAPFTGVLGANGACEPIALTFFNREERGAAAAGVDFSPLPPGTPGSSLCWESTVMSIRNGAAHNPTGSVSGVLGSVNTVPINITSTFQSGWMNVAFTGAAATAPGITSAATSTTTNVNTGVAVVGAQTFVGLPVVGFMVRTFNNGNISSGGSTVLSNYGSAFDHKYRQTVTPTP
jgi:hypothetical protein